MSNKQAKRTISHPYETVSQAPLTPITQFYDGKSVFITGGTGFLGKVLIEKLLYVCNIKNIYLLIKPKKGKDIEDRMLELKNHMVFNRINQRDSKILNKIRPIPGDLHDKQLGISEENLQLLCNEISVVFHVAANLKFNCTVREMINTNTRPTEVLLNISRNMLQLQAFIYVSTAYSNNNRDFIGEQVYPTCCPLSSTYYIVDEIENNHLIDNIMEKRANSYNYSKAVAEELIQNQFNDLPMAIVRPTAIISSLSEPVSGWVEGWHSANSVIVASGQGVLRSWYCEPDSVADLIPVDLVSNLIIASAWDIHMTRKQLDDKQNPLNINKVKVYNCSSGLQNPISVRKFMSTCLQNVRKNPYKETLFYPTLLITNCYVLHWIVLMLFQIIPALIIDFISFLSGQNMRMRAIQHRLKLLQQVLGFFTSNQFTFDDHNVWKLNKKLDQFDKKIFNIDIKTVNWESFLDKYVVGLKKYLVKEN